MRLIDADKLKVYLQEYLHYGHAIPWVDAQPTAYDVEKVVAELEEERFKFRQMGLEAVRKGMAIHSDTFLAKQYSYEYAIDIVKRGGVE